MKLIPSFAVLFASRAVVALTGFLLIPLYLQHLGVAALGVITLFLSIQACLLVFDLGLSTSASTRAANLALDASDHQMGALLKLSEDMYWLIGLLACMGLWLLSTLLLPKWLWSAVENSSPTGWASVTNLLACLSLLLTWPQNYYAAVLSGSYRQKILAYIVVVSALMKLLIVYMILKYAPNLLMLYSALCAVALVQTAWMRYASRLLYKQVAARLTWNDMKQSIKHSLDRNLLLIAAIGTILAQGDKVYLSMLLPVTEYAAYAVAAMLCGSLYMLINPLYTMLLPYFMAVLSKKDDQLLRGRYQQASQIAAILVVPAGLLLVFFCNVGLELWLDDPKMIETASPVLYWLAVGTTAHGLLYVPYSLQIATGWTSLALRMNLALLAMLLPLLYVGSHLWGAAGAAACWAVINLTFLLIWPALMHRRLIVGYALRWNAKFVFLPVIITCIVMYLFRFILLGSVQSMVVLAAGALAAYLASFLCVAIAMPYSRSKLFQYFKNSPAA